MLKNSSTLVVGIYVPINLSIKLGVVPVNVPTDRPMWYVNCVNVLYLQVTVTNVNKK